MLEFKTPYLKVHGGLLCFALFSTLRLRALLTILGSSDSKSILVTTISRLAKYSCAQQRESLETSNILRSTSLRVRTSLLSVRI